MKWMLSAVVFAMVLGGVFSKSVAAEGGAEHTAEGGAEHSIGVKQPVADKSKATYPGTVTLLEPKALAKVGNAVTLKWQAAQNADVYQVQVATDPRFKWLVVNEYDVTGESFQVPNLEPGQYFWQVAARKPNNDPSWTRGFFTNSSFEVK